MQMLFFNSNILQIQVPKGRDVEDDDSFEFDETFTAPLYRIKVLKNFKT